jgi:acyl carrier protein
MKNITKSEIVEFLKHQVVKECEVPYPEVDVHVEFVTFRMDSLKAVYIMDRLEKFVGVELSPLYFWDNPTIDSLAGFIAAMDDSP